MGGSERDGSREGNYRKRVSGVKASEGAEASRLNESEADFVVLCPNRFKDSAGKGVLASAKIMGFKALF